MIELPEFETQKETFDFLVKNENTIFAQKKAELKQADGFGYNHVLSMNKSVKAVKANNPIINPPDVLNVKAIINTTNFMDSHKDVHLPGIWNKSLQDNSDLIFLQEHKWAFDKIMADGGDLDAFTRNYSWKDLGFDYDGMTEALVFDAAIRKDRNEFMWDQYSKGWVKNHSVGMRYVKMVTCINDEDYGAQYEAWQKYRPDVVNGDEADQFGYFWAIKEAKAVEGSAVPKGSNIATPTLENNMKAETQEEEPVETTPKVEPETKSFADKYFL